MAGISDSGPDSIFTWMFLATTGESWGGWLVEDSDRYAVGATLAATHGLYTILMEDPRGQDLSFAGLEDATVFVEWYRDASGQFLPVRGGASLPASMVGIGAERDAAWNGTAWDTFGAGGTDVVELADPPDSIYDWVFTADTGDMLWGTLIADSGSQVLNEPIRAARGTYRIVGETPQGVDLGPTRPEGTVTTSRYRDSAAAADLRLQSEGGPATGFTGLGSEVDYAWTGAAWQQVGLGGAAQADATVDRFFTWAFESALDGDIWVGWTVGYSAQSSVGDSWATPRGRYTIYDAAPWGGAADMVGTVWSVAYHDAATQSWLGTWAWGVFNAAVPGRGLGNEYDFAWDGREWDNYGADGIHTVHVELPRRFIWYFEAGAGSEDLYVGFLLEDATRLSVGDTIAGANGTYVIFDSTDWAGGADALGTVWVTTYYHGQSAQWLPTYHYGQLGLPVTRQGLGSEYEYAWDGREWDHFGGGGAYDVGVEVPRRFLWYLQTADGSNDFYVGFLLEDAGSVSVGDTIAGANGTYVIFDSTDWAGGADALGTVWVTTYYDGYAAQWLPTYHYGQFGLPVTRQGLGNEYEFAWDGSEWDHFGGGGHYQADVGPDAFYEWSFLSDRGDRYGGWLVEDANRYRPGDTIAAARGTYSILSETPYVKPAAIPDGTTWIGDYYDAESGRSLPTLSFSVNLTYSSVWGLGSEYEHAWDGSRWVGFGVGGIHQVDIAPGAPEGPISPFGV